MEDITSKQGENHVTSTQFRAILAAVLGSGSYIADQDDQLEPELAANNILNIHSGVLIHHGSVRRVPPGTYDQVAYLNGTQAMKRIDLVVVRYTKRGGIETSEWVVIQGTPAESDPEVPAHTEGNMQNGDLVDDCPVFELHFDGINVTEVKTLLDVISNVEALSTELNYMKGVTSNVQEQISDLNSTLSNLTITKIMRFNLYLELSAETNSYELFTLSKLNELFGVSGATAPCFTILVNNADGEAFGSHIDSCVWLNGNAFYITWNEVLSVNKNARVYVTVFYTPLANVIKSI